MTRTQTIPLHSEVEIRWLIRRDMDEVLKIEWRSSPSPWSEEQFILVLRQRNCIGTVAVTGHGVIAGFMVYELHKSTLRLLNLAVDPFHRRSLVGRQLIQRLQDKLKNQRRTLITADVRETNLSGQKFFAACGFRAEQVISEHFGDTGEDAYQFRYWEEQP